MPRGQILVVDDQPNMRATLGLLLRQEGYQVSEAGGGEDAIRLMDDQPADLVITDLKMAPMDGMEVLRNARARTPPVEVIVMTAFGTIESAVEAMRIGAHDYITKPFRQEEILIRIEKALEKGRLAREYSLLKSEFNDRHQITRMAGESEAILQIQRRILRVAATDSTVLITGESGTGKELAARAIHAASPRKDRPFVTVNCAAISEQILESELFGHARGSFTGAVSARKGLFEEAEGGTFFFDEIGEVSPAIQAKLLRAIQQREIRRVGENKPIQVDVRMLAATNRDLSRSIEEGRFREDLYYRLNVMPVHMPPLRERREDIAPLLRHFVHQFNARFGRSTTVGPDVIPHLMKYDFPGNVRELENMTEQAVGLADGGALTAADFVFGGGKRSITGGGEPALPIEPLEDSIARVEAAAIRASLRRHKGKTDEVAHELGLSPTTLWRKMKRLDIKEKPG
ncbi:MAG: Transcriptional regulatory protein ZraR [Myxococcota bacterium]|nr:Transcriptional regulatory protein ZraR [Myxococcota bacterium]